VVLEAPPRALGELVGSAKEGLLALSVGVGLGVLAELLEQEVGEVVGAKGKHIVDRVAVRHGHESGEVTLGGRRVAVERVGCANSVSTLLFGIRGSGWRGRCDWAREPMLLGFGRIRLGRAGVARNGVPRGAGRDLANNGSRARANIRDRVGLQMLRAGR
jgi:hypothetical protein